MRTPMQWSDQEGAGFCETEPWLPVARDYRRINVEAERNDEGSMLCLVKRLIELRGREPALAVGDYYPVNSNADGVLAFCRRYEGKRFLIALNFAHRKRQLQMEQESWAGEVLISTDPQRGDRWVSGEVDMAGDEGVIVALGEEG